MIYTLHVQSGMEWNALAKLRGQGIKAYAPKKNMLLRRKGEWKYEQSYLFPGYIFIDVKLTNDIYYTTKNTAGVIRFLGDPTPLSCSEQKRLQWIFDSELIGISRGFVKDGKLIITEGLLKGKESQIVSWDIRQKRCRLRCEINGRPHTYFVSAEITRA
ncbi:transcription termination/antitermination NusG family protein [Ruminococcus flavefaciens]|uniref:transcription termination/antitermination NusG family protein n=1 Tax=Ruminococcus flavefaciens TaxID=1265 RepID=UPI0026EB45B7|nr:transcription termination/antitermination NusG family protein [Ruminococcus flavefaciens]